jgi:hypothetical protein
MRVLRDLTGTSGVCSALAFCDPGPPGELLHNAIVPRACFVASSAPTSPRTSYRHCFSYGPQEVRILFFPLGELRGGTDASQYNDYLHVLLFIKCVGDKHAGQPRAPITIPKGAVVKGRQLLKRDCEYLCA